MTEHAPSTPGHGSLTTYVIGFIFSIVLTLGAYFAVVNEMFPTRTAVLVVEELAMLQLFVQLVFFLHLGRESKPYWNALLFFFATTMILIISIGSIWIMKNLDYNVFPDAVIIQDEGFTP